MAHSKYYERFISQLDDLVVFMSLSNIDFFTELKKKWGSLTELNEVSEEPISENQYEQIILRSALLLGITYLEAYIADILRDIYFKKPEVLTARNKTLSWEKIIRLKNYDGVINQIIESELLEFTHKSTENMVEYLEKQLTLDLDIDTDNLKEASLVRNCITHNGAIASRELQELNFDFQDGEEICLTAGIVHRYGLNGRTFVRELDEILVSKFSVEYA